MVGGTHQPPGTLRKTRPQAAGGGPTEVSWTLNKAKSAVDLSTMQIPRKATKSTQESVGSYLG